MTVPRLPAAIALSGNPANIDIGRAEWRNSEQIRGGYRFSDDDLRAFSEEGKKNRG